MSEHVDMPVFGPGPVLSSPPPRLASRASTPGTPGDVRAGLAPLLPRLRRFALAMTGTPHDADDLVQSAVERALGRADQWRVGTRLDSWMYRIIQNLWIDQARQRRSHREVAPLGEVLQVVGEDGRDTADRRLALQNAREAFAALPADMRAVAGLVILNGLSYREAAATLRIPIGTVMSRVARARQALGAALTPSIRAAAH